MRSKINFLCKILLVIPFTIIPKVVTCENNPYYETNVSQNMEIAKSLWLELDDNISTMSFSMNIDPTSQKSWDEMDAYYKYDKIREQNLSFDFPFYGHPIHRVRIDWNGRIVTPNYQGQFPHTFAIYSFISPYNFLLVSNNKHVTVRSFNTDSQLRVQWEITMIADSSYASKSCKFQATLYNTGNIVFVYKNCEWPLRVNPRGLSDTYEMDNGIRHVYDHLKGPDILNNNYRSSWISIHFTPRPTCLNHKDCSSCLSHPSTSHMTCFWCPTANLCSTGKDWYHQVWVENNCDKKTIKKSQSCPVSSTTTTTTMPKIKTIRTTTTTMPKITTTNTTPMPRITTTNTTTMPKITTIKIDENEPTDPDDIQSSDKKSGKKKKPIFRKYSPEKEDQQIERSEFDKSIPSSEKTSGNGEPKEQKSTQSVQTKDKITKSPQPKQSAKVEYKTQESVSFENKDEFVKPTEVISEEVEYAEKSSLPDNLSITSAGKIKVDLTTTIKIDENEPQDTDDTESSGKKGGVKKKPVKFRKYSPEKEGESSKATEKDLEHKEKTLSDVPTSSKGVQNEQKGVSFDTENEYPKSTEMSMEEMKLTKKTKPSKSTEKEVKLEVESSPATKREQKKEKPTSAKRDPSKLSDCITEEVKYAKEEIPLPDDLNTTSSATLDTDSSVPSTEDFNIAVTTNIKLDDKESEIIPGDSQDDNKKHEKKKKPVKFRKYSPEKEDGQIPRSVVQSTTSSDKTVESTKAPERRQSSSPEIESKLERKGEPKEHKSTQSVQKKAKTSKGPQPGKSAEAEIILKESVSFVNDGGSIKSIEIPSEEVKQVKEKSPVPEELSTSSSAGLDDDTSASVTEEINVAITTTIKVDNKESEKMPEDTEDFVNKHEKKRKPVKFRKYSPEPNDLKFPFVIYLGAH
uniref:Plexin domain-containing protein 2 n=1 Tax=Cacopsylla melanoneura TaxID=428564 RepID=A0A8D9AP63_9HEMI